MMFWKSFSIFIVLMMGLFSFNAQSRSPAVDPVMGLSIEEYDHAPPAQAQSFDFSQAQSSQELRTPTSEAITPRTLQQSSGEGSGPATYFYILMSLLPFVIWFGVMKNLEKQDQKMTSLPENMYDLDSERNKRKADSSDDSDLPKAS